MNTFFIFFGALIAGMILHEALGLYIKSYRTVTKNLSLAVAAFAAWAAGYDWTQLLEPAQAYLVAAWIGLYQTYMRFRTNTKVGDG